MNTQALNVESLLRKVLTDIAQLPPNDLLIVYETITDLKQKEKMGKNAPMADEILARAKSRAAELRHLSHAEKAQRFIDATDKIRTEALEKGVAIEGEWESD